MNVALESPEMLLLIIPVIVAGFYLLRKTKTKLVEWRMLVALLLVLALAAPYTTVTQTISEEDPSLVFVQDQTASMGIFPEETGTGLYEALTANTPTTLVQLTGDKTSLGDAVTQYSGLGNQIVLVTDGNNNAGKDLSDALIFAKDADTPVYLVQPELETNDLSVEVLGDKTVVVNNQNEFEIVVRQASEQSVSYFLEIFVDEALIQSRTFTQNARNNTIPINQAFTTLGAHNIRVKISDVSGGDLNEVNNEFYKSLYVIPKPKLTLITGETGSPLASVLSNLYEVSVVNGYPGAGNITDSKVLVLDNQFIDTFSEAEIKEIKNYVSNGGGLIVVGGDKAYNYGKYLNSSLEEVLPVLSKPSEFKGGRNLVLILDVSPSTAAHGTQGDILSNAIYILRNENLKDANVGVIAFGSVGYDVSGGFVFMGLPQNLALLEDKISQLTPSDQTETSLDQGLDVTKDMLEGEDGELDAIIISDGGIEDSYDQSLQTARELKDMGVNLYFIHIRSTAPSQTDKTRNFYAEKLMQDLGLENNYKHIEMGERANIGFEDLDMTPEDETKSEELDSYLLLEYSPDHFITKGVNLTNASITGYNQVTPKAGAERLVITVTGQPVLTTWRFGLGRVAAFTTDNGGSEATRWSSVLYNGSNSRLISGMANWAIGNPQAEEGAVVEAPDTWLGTPSDLTLIMYDEGVPQLKLDGASLDLALTGRNTYEASINPVNVGIHDISGYPLAVNYPREYLEVGLNKDIEPLILATGGKIYTEKEARALLLKDARQNSERESNEPVSLKVYVLLAALVLYLGEILVRRIREMRRLKQAQGEAEKEEAAA
ncbi:von Willebrand factor A [Methanosarcina sp. 2.H.T.1A.6]|uniref:vWA domain-containing protein n=1 Tax=unclassified Methanosarcina TaxID=2644672 RepID=UPI0006219C87|nr:MULTISPECIES: vWA domain-containing protein [unclassified Methanosarcina]KKG17569.1 von Willebrand factor A [Methanosarcina sp. 2.H.T.1A.3]KKG20453.1 von Willebrand factor A [Methanosarcina sp. 2.H.T.1A.6]KKG27343.1 von Willebrand factor A [Methanosarcina sp. 2.H.T.1A.8]KKG27549.1 von Willebrand factor A [Methanosarcina sp. 2.H.T.1A.15]